MENIFKKGDRVYHFYWGWGILYRNLGGSGCANVTFDKSGKQYVFINQLSFAEYDLVKGGLSHERPFKLEVEKSSEFDLDGILNENIICNDPESFTEAIKRLVSEKLEELEFEPFQRVLVRDSDESTWRIDFFSRMLPGDNTYTYECLRNIWKQCIPFEGNEHLLQNYVIKTKSNK